MLGLIRIIGRQCTGGGHKPANKQVVFLDDRLLQMKLSHQAHIVALSEKTQSMQGTLEDAHQIQKSLHHMTTEVVACHCHHHGGGGGQRREQQVQQEAMATWNIDNYHQLEEIDEDPWIVRDNCHQIGSKRSLPIACFASRSLPRASYGRMLTLPPLLHHCGRLARHPITQPTAMAGGGMRLHCHPAPITLSRPQAQA
jgi:hypothetical protein